MKYQRPVLVDLGANARVDGWLCMNGAGAFSGPGEFCATVTLRGTLTALGGAGVVDGSGGAISVTERTGYIKRVRRLARASAVGYLKMREEMGFPLLTHGAGEG